MSTVDGHLREQPESRRAVFEGRLLHVFEDTVRLPSGRTARREVVEHVGAVAIVARTEDGRVVLVRQWRHAVGRALWEIPAGTRDRDEDAEATARRELLEETGYAASGWRELGHGPVSPGYSSEVLRFYEATGLTAGVATPDADELLDVEAFDPAGLHDLAERGELDIKTIGGLALAGITIGPAGG